MGWIDVHAAMGRLASDRPLFHSEADFQHAIAWDLHRLMPDAQIRLERVITTSSGLLHVDLLVHRGQDRFVCELKYKTRALTLTTQNETFALKSHTAQPIGRYDFLKDVARLESIRKIDPLASCWAILLTNDSVYWCEPAADEVRTSTAFSLHAGRECTGSLPWGPSASAGTTRGREAPIQLSGSYNLEWREYSQVDVKKAGRFRYMALEIA
jgi:hypothetical protein